MHSGHRFADASIDEHLIHDESIDGLADFVFWGRDAEALGAAVGAPAIDERTWGWLDHGVREPIQDHATNAEVVGRRVERAPARPALE